MIAADSALFVALGHYFTGMAQIHRAALRKSESMGLKKAAPLFKKALKEVRSMRDCESRLLEIAQPIEDSAYYVRRHQVLSEDTTDFLNGLEAITTDLTEGFYPAAACTTLNTILTRLMANMESNARVEGVLSRIEVFGNTGCG